MTKIAITNVHLDLGAGRRGTDMGPSAIHVAQKPRLKRIGHNISRIHSIGSKSYEALDVTEANARFHLIFEDLHDLEANRHPKPRQRVFSSYWAAITRKPVGTISGIATHFQISGT